MFDDKHGTGSVLQFFPKLLDGVDGARCRPDKFFHSKLGKPFLYVAGFVHREFVMLKQEKAFL